MTPRRFLITCLAGLLFVLTGCTGMPRIFMGLATPPPHTPVP